MSDSPPAPAPRPVFLSYASQDAEAVERIAVALRAAGVEVWFDQNELTGGDAWDAKIRGQIKSCVLFVPVISAATQARREGYFRLEWKLAAQRTHTMADGTPFLLPVVIDATKDGEALVPEEFRAVQWTRLPGGQTAAVEKFGARVKQLLSGPGSTSDPATSVPAQNVSPERQTTPPKSSHPWLWTVALGAAGLIAVALWHRWREAAPTPESAPKAAIGVTAATAKPASETQRLIAKVWTLLNKPGMSRAELDAADALCKHATTLDPADADAWAAWARTDTFFIHHSFDASATRREAAREHAARAMQLAPSSFEARLAQAAYWADGVPALSAKPAKSDATRLLRELLSERPDEPRTLFLLAHFLPEKKRDEMFEQLAKNPGFTALALNDLAWMLIFDAKFRESEAVLERSLAAHAYWDNLGLKVFLSLYWHGDLDLAKESLEKFPAADAQEDWGINLAVQISALRGDFSDGLAVLDRTPRDWIASNFFEGPKVLLSAGLRRLGGQNELARRDYQRALALLESRLAADPNNFDFLQEKAEVLYHLGERVEAEKCYRLLKESGQNPLPDVQALFEPDAAISSLEKNRSIFSSAASLRLVPAYAPLRNQPRFIALLAQAEADPAKSPKARIPSDLAAKSVAVLAFADNSPAHDSEYFSDGISEELINALGKIPGLKVPARTSSFYFKGKSVPVPEIAKQLGVAYVVEGSVQRLGEKVKISASLSKATDGFQEMSETFTRDAKNVFAVEEEIAGLIAKKLSLRLGVSSTAATASVNPEALDAYLHADQLMRLRDTIFTNVERVEELLNRALALEPNFSRAQAMLAEVLVARGSTLQTSTNNRFGHRHTPERERIEAMARQAIALDPTAPEPHVALGVGMWTWWDREGAERELRTAIALNPSDARAHRQLGWVLMDDGRMDDAIAEANVAVQFDPFSQSVIESQARILHVAGHYTEALAGYDRALALADSAMARQHKAYALAQLGRKDAALAIARELPTPALRFRPLAVAGAQAEAEQILLATEPQNRAYLWFVLGRTEEGLAALDPDEIQSTNLHDILFEPWFDPVRAKPRFQQVLATLGVTEAHARAQAWRAAHPPEKPAAKP